MQTLELKPAHKTVQSYYAALPQFEELGVRHETAVRSAFQNLLAHCARQRRDISAAIAVEEQVIAPLDPSLDEVDLLSEQGMKWMRNADRCSHLSGAACSWSVG
jgi:hypothetical protein